MRIYTKRLLISFLAFVLGVSITACNKDNTDTQSPNDSVIPEVTNMDQIYLQNDTYTITYGDLYAIIKANDGINQLLMMVDSDLLSEYLDEVTDAEIATKIEQLTYGTNDQDTISALTDDQKADYETTFSNKMYLTGFGDRVEEYVRVILAREHYAVEQMFDINNAEESWYAGPTAIAKSYESNYNYDINTIKIRFLSETDAKSVMRMFNLVSMNGEMRLYTGVTPLAQVPSSALNDTNTVALTDEEILQKFILMYNYIYSGYRTALSESATVEDLLANEDLILTRDEIANANAKLDDFVYDSLGNYVDYVSGVNTKLYYTYEPMKYYGSNDTSYYLILNLSQTEKADVTDFSGTETELANLIGQDIYDQLEQDIIDNNLATTSFAANRVITLRQEHGFDIYDYYLGLDYQSIDVDFVLNEEGNSTNVAGYDDVLITANQLLAFSLDNNAPLYAIYASQLPSMLNSHYEDVYCVDMDVCDYDPDTNTSDMMVQHFDDLASLKTQFDASYLASLYTFSEFVYVQYGSKSDSEMVMNYYVKSTLQPLYIYDQIMTDDYAILDYLMELAQPYYDNYFSLNVEHLLIGVDRDEDGTPDDYDAFYAGLENQAAFDQLLDDFKLQIDNYLNESGNSMSTLITDYKKAAREDLVWGAYKRYGLILVNESLGEMTYADSIDVYEQPFVDALISMYQDYQLPENINESYIYSDGYVHTVYGEHLIKASKGTDFEMPSALFTMTYDDDNQPEYEAGMVNLTDEISLDQLKLYAISRFFEISDSGIDLETIYGMTAPAIPSSVSTAIDTFYADLYDALYVVGYMNEVVINELLASTYVNADTTYCSMTEAQFTERLNNIHDIYMYQIFADLDKR